MPLGISFGRVWKFYSGKSNRIREFNSVRPYFIKCAVQLQMVWSFCVIDGPTVGDIELHCFFTLSWVKVKRSSLVWNQKVGRWNKK